MSYRVGVLRVAGAVAAKDLLTEWRSRDRVVAMGVFSMLVVIAFHFALPTGTGSEGIQDNAAGLIHILENENDSMLRREALQMLTMIDNQEATEYLFRMLEDEQ